MQKWERFFPNPDYMNIPSFSRSVSRGSAVGWFLVLLLVCGAGAGYYLYQDNLAKRKAAQELTAERKLKEKKAREAAEKQRIKREREIREKIWPPLLWNDKVIPLWRGITANGMGKLILLPKREKPFTLQR